MKPWLQNRVHPSRYQPGATAQCWLYKKQLKNFQNHMVLTMFLSEHFPSEIFLGDSRSSFWCFKINWVFLYKHFLLQKHHTYGRLEKNFPRVNEGDALFKIRTAKVGDVSWFLVCFFFILFVQLLGWLFFDVEELKDVEHNMRCEHIWNNQILYYNKHMTNVFQHFTVSASLPDFVHQEYHELEIQEQGADLQGANFISNK